MHCSHFIFQSNKRIYVVSSSNSDIAPSSWTWPSVNQTRYLLVLPRNMLRPFVRGEESAHLFEMSTLTWLYGVTSEKTAIFIVIVSLSPAGKRNCCGQSLALASVPSCPAPRTVRSAHIVQTCRVGQNNGNTSDTAHFFMKVVLDYICLSPWNGLVHILNSL
jgi:hypothetical protein